MRHTVGLVTIDASISWYVVMSTAGAFLYYYSPGQVIDKNGGGFYIPVPGGM